MIQRRQWSKVKHAIRQDVSVAMRVNDSAEEDHWFARAREAAWRKDIGLICSSNEENYFDGRFDQNSEDSEEMAASMRYWVSNSTNNASLRQRCTLLHSICKLKFHSDEALITQTQLINGDSDELRNLVGAIKVVQMIIDASHNELKPYPDDGKEDYYLELCDGEVNECNRLNNHLIGSEKCQTCSCYYHSQYCPPVCLDPVERYSEAEEEFDEDLKKRLHYSVLTTTDALGATPLHLLTGQGSGHIDFVRTFIDGCCELNNEADAKTKRQSRRPTLYDFCAAQNGHGCTSFHFLSDDSHEEVLHLLLERLEKENDKLKLFNWQQCGISSTKAETKLHPLLIQDDDGDTPLHFACGNGASVSLLTTLTTHPGSPYAVVVRNTERKLAVDELITWYTENDDESGSENGDDDSNSGSDSSQISTDREEEDITKVQYLNPEDIVTQALHSFVVPIAQSSSEHCKCNFVDRMRVLIQAGGKCIGLSAQSFDIIEQNRIHVSVIVTKCFNFPAVALVSSLLSLIDELDESDSQNDFDTKHYAKMALLQQDSGFLPLHWACGGIKGILSSEATISDTDHNSMTTSNLAGTSRWGVQVGCSMISYLLNLCPESARVPDRAGRLPLHLFLDDAYYNSREDLVTLLKAYPEALRTPDVQSHMYPFQTAAAATNELNNNTLKSLDVIYCLIREDPSLCRAMDKSE
jgi:hypothetical protein